MKWGPEKLSRPTYTLSCLLRRDLSSVPQGMSLMSENVLYRLSSFTDLLRYNLPVIKLIRYKCMVQRFLINLSSRATTTTILFWNTSGTRNFPSAGLQSILAPTLSSRHHGSVFCFSGFAFLSNLIPHHIIEVQPQCCTYQKSIPFYS